MLIKGYYLRPYKAIIKESWLSAEEGGGGIPEAVSFINNLNKQRNPKSAQKTKKNKICLVIYNAFHFSTKK